MVTIFGEIGGDPLQRCNRKCWTVKRKEMRPQIRWQDLLSFRSLNQESVDALQAARSSSLVDGRLAHIVLSEDQNTAMSQNMPEALGKKFHRQIFPLSFLLPRRQNRPGQSLNFSPRLPAPLHAQTHAHTHTQT